MTIKAKYIYESHSARTNPVTELADAFGASLGHRLACHVQEDGKYMRSGCLTCLKDKDSETLMLTEVISVRVN